MFGFSLGKLLVLTLLIVTIWYGFKFFERRGKNLKEKKITRAIKNGDDGVHDMEKCIECGTFVPNKASKNCGRENCPYINENSD